MSVGYSNLFDSSGNVKERRFVAGETVTVYGHWEYDAALTSATNTTNTYYKAQLVPVPAGAMILNWISTVTDSDSGATTTYNLGDGTDGTRFASALTTAQAGGNATPASGVTITTSSGIINKGIGYTYTEDDTIDFQIQTGSSGSATSGTVGLMVTYYCNPSYK